MNRRHQRYSARPFACKTVHLQIFIHMLTFYEGDTDLVHFCCRKFIKLNKLSNGWAYISLIHSNITHHYILSISIRDTSKNGSCMHKSYVHILGWLVAKEKKTFLHTYVHLAAFSISSNVYSFLHSSNRSAESLFLCVHTGVFFPSRYAILGQKYSTSMDYRDILCVLNSMHIMLL